MKPTYIFKLKDKEIHREEGFMCNIHRGKRVKWDDKTYEIGNIEVEIKTNIHTCDLILLNEKQLNKEQIKEKVVQPKLEKKFSTGKIMIQSRERLPEKNNKWSNWLNNTPCNNLEEAQNMLAELKNTESNSLQFRICDKSKKQKEDIETTNDNPIEEKPKKTEVAEKPYIIQYKERDKTTGVFSGWKLLERFETPEQRNEHFTNMIREANRLYTVKNVRVTRQHINDEIEE